MPLCVCCISAVWRSPWVSWRAWYNRTRRSISTRACFSTWPLCMSWNHLAAPRKSRLCWRLWPVERGTVSTHNAWNWCKIAALWQQVWPKRKIYEVKWKKERNHAVTGTQRRMVGLISKAAKWSDIFPHQMRMECWTQGHVTISNSTFIYKHRKRSQIVSEQERALKKVCYSVSFYFMWSFHYHNVSLS